MSDNEIYLLIKYIKSVLWRVAKRLSYMQDARCLKVNFSKFRASRLATPFTLILLTETCSSGTCFGLVARPLVTGRVEGTEDRHPNIYDRAHCDVQSVAVINL